MEITIIPNMYWEQVQRNDEQIWRQRIPLADTSTDIKVSSSGLVINDTARDVVVTDLYSVYSVLSKVESIQSFEQKIMYNIKYHATSILIKTCHCKMSWRVRRNSYETMQVKAGKLILEIDYQ